MFRYSDINAALDAPDTDGGAAAANSLLRALLCLVPSNPSPPRLGFGRAPPLGRLRRAVAAALAWLGGRAGRRRHRAAVRCDEAGVVHH